MPSKIVVGLDGVGSGQRALAFAKRQAKLVGDCEIVVVYVVEWSPFSFHTAEENAERHKTRTAEIKTATDRVVSPALEELKSEGFEASGTVRHGDVAQALSLFATEIAAEQIVVARSSEHGIASRIFGSSTANLVMHATVPVTVVA
ncbi:MAG: universal stress protein [Pseudomonadota bacterium]